MMKIKNYILLRGLVGGVIGFVISFLTVGIKSLFFLGYIPMKIATLTECESWQCAPFYLISSILFYTLIGLLFGLVTYLIRDKKQFMSSLFRIFFFIIILVLSISSAQAESVKEDITAIIQNINISIDGSSVLRSGSEFIVRIIIINKNEKENITLKKIDILKSNELKFQEVYVNKIINPIGEAIKDSKNLKDTVMKKGESYIPEFRSKYQGLVSKMQEGIFVKSFKLNIYDFKSRPEVGKTIMIPIVVEFNYNNKNFIINQSHTVLISEPLPAPSHNSPGWYKGDQHMHSEYSNSIYDWWSIPSISEMVDEATSEDLEWVIFTDHSPAFSEASEWEDGYDVCTAERNMGCIV